MQLEIAQQSEVSQLNNALSNPLIGNSADACVLMTPIGTVTPCLDHGEAALEGAGGARNP
jgi:hypothetical protein